MQGNQLPGLESLLTPVALVGQLIAFAVGAAASYAVTKGTERKRWLVFDRVQRETIIDEIGDEEFSLTYRGDPIPNLHLILLRLWNRGGMSVQRANLSSTAPLTIEVGADARVLGDPRVLSRVEGTGATATQTAVDVYEVSFDILNPGEWVEFAFLCSGARKVAIRVAGRVADQRGPVSMLALERRASVLERAGVFGVLVILTAPPFALLGVAIWLYRLNRTMADALRHSNELPSGLQILLWLTILAPMLAVTSVITRLYKRAKNPSVYPLPEDYGRSFWDVYRASWRTVRTGRRSDTWGDILDSLEEARRPADAPDV